MNRESLDRYNDRALARAEASYLEPDDDDSYDYPVAKCDKCGCEMYVGETMFEGYDGEWLCDECFRDVAREHSKELEAPEPAEPDWDSMPGGWDRDV